MGCIHSVGCTGMCAGCSSFRREEYEGHSEDLMAQELGYLDYNDYQNETFFDEPLEEESWEYLIDSDD